MRILHVSLFMLFLSLSGCHATSGGVLGGALGGGVGSALGGPWGGALGGGLGAAVGQRHDGYGYDGHYEDHGDHYYERRRHRHRHHYEDDDDDRLLRRLVSADQVHERVIGAERGPRRARH